MTTFHFLKALVIALACICAIESSAFSQDSYGNKKNKSDFVLVRSADTKREFLGGQYRPIEEVVNAKIHARLRGVWQYGLLSEASYDKKIDPSGRLTLKCDRSTRYLARWRHLPDYSTENYKVKRKSVRLSVPGLSYRVWRDTSAAGPNRVAIVFRGTELDDLGDWYSNFRWLTKFNPITTDQYHATTELVMQLVPSLLGDFGPDLEIVAVGHSLGGGLAQRAGYSSPHISTVYAFSTSPVIGNPSSDREVNQKNREGLVIFRVFESGEILAAGRWLHRKLIDLSSKNPKVIELVFSFRHGFFSRRSTGDGTISQHSIRKLTCDLICHVEHGIDNEVCTGKRNATGPAR